MEELFAYHAVTEKPMYIGQHIVFDKIIITVFGKG